MRTLVVLVVVLSALARPARGDAGDTVLSQDPMYGKPGSAMGYTMDATSYYDVAYTFELAAWPTAGAGRVVLSGLNYTEHKGLLTNLLAMVLGMGSTGHYETRGGTTYYVYYPAAQKALLDSFSQLPLSLSLRLFDQSVFSEMSGYAIDVGMDGPLAGGGGAWNAGLTFGSLESNPYGAPAVMPVPGMPTPERVVHQRGWFGGYLDVHYAVARGGNLGVRAKVTAAFAGPFMILAEVGPELFIGNRLQLRVYATADALEAADGLGARAELGVRF